MVDVCLIFYNEVVFCWRKPVSTLYRVWTPAFAGVTLTYFCHTGLDPVSSWLGCFVVLSEVASRMIKATSDKTKNHWPSFNQASD
tara:strand:+ start:2630 stop:2884 length:255 start_codon:yes stop_codon:yes gene_type:complete